jgi:peptide/nickel transport system ATP-binding protein
LINRPSGCHFHPRCPYVQPRHREVDPRLVAVPGAAGHAVACLLEAQTRAAIWQALRSGQTPSQASLLAGGSETGARTTAAGGGAEVATDE